MEKGFLWNTRATIKNQTEDLSSSAFNSHQKLGLLTSVETARIVSIADGASTDSLPSHQLRVSLCPEAQRLCFLLFLFSLKNIFSSTAERSFCHMNVKFISLISKILVSVVPCSDHETATMAEVWLKFSWQWVDKVTSYLNGVTNSGWRINCGLSFNSS